jgi:Flp pilus assembly protein TadG
MNRHSNFGFPTILLSFVMICILTFSALALVTANSDYRLSQKTEANNTAYYDAEEEAYLTLAGIDSALAACYGSSTDEASYFALAAETLPELCGGSLSESADGCVLTYTTAIRDSRYLRVVLVVCYPTGTDDHFYEIREWKSVQETTYVEDSTYHLIGNES